jgi:PAS domain S-box-containing protein
MKSKSKTKDDLLLHVEDLKMRLEEAEELLRAIRMGEVDALVVSGSDGDQIYTLKGATQPYRILVESMSEGALTLTADGTVYYCNKRFSEIVRTPPEKIIGSSVYGFVAQDDQERVRTILDQGREQGSRGETCLRAADGTLVPVHLSISPLRSDENIVVCAVITDLTEQKQHEKILASEAVLRGVKEELEIRVLERTADLERRNQELQEFAFVASHDLQEPLRKVQTFGEMLAKKSATSLGAEGRDYVRRMQKAAARMQKLLGSLLSYSRVTTKSEPLIQTDLRQSVGGALSNLEVLIKDKGALVKVDTLPTVEADRSQMIQLFQNLIGNALKFQRENETPRVSIYSGGSGKGEGRKQRVHEIRVEDNGIGFDEKYLDKIFVPFQRLHGRNDYEGVGMGLAICKKIVERHGGQITARSKLGKGSTFIVTLPAKQKPVISDQ